LALEPGTEFYLASQVRRVKLTGLPMNSTLETVASFVWGGKVEAIIFKPGSTTADVLFLKHEDCMKYYHATSNGIPFPDQPKHFIEVALHTDADPVQDRVRGFIERDITRVIYAANIPMNLSLEFFEKIAKGNKNELSVEKVRVGRFEKNRAVEFRMGSIYGKSFTPYYFHCKIHTYNCPRRHQIDGYPPTR
jgi:hypothetical protein